MKKNILFVDNEPMMEVALNLTFRKAEDFQITFVKSKVDAIKVLAQVQIDAVVSDYNLDDGNGIDFLMENKKYYPEMRTAIMTGEKTEMLESACRDAGIDTIFPKSSLNRMVVETLRELIGTKHG